MFTKIALAFLAIGVSLQASSCADREPDSDQATSALTSITCGPPPAAVPTGYFRGPCTTSGGNLTITTCTCYPSAPDNPTVAFDYSMPDQTGLDPDGDGIVNLSPAGHSPNPGSYLPASWTVRLSCTTTLAPSYSWDVRRSDGTLVDHQDTAACGTSFNVPAQGTYRVKLTAKYSDSWRTLEKDISVKNYLIVSLGDSVASGEGNPDTPVFHYSDPHYTDPAVWENKSCHRSAKSGPALAALQLERADPHSSVTFLSAACSGAKIDQLPGTPAGAGGVLAPYRGIESDGGLWWDAQLGSVARLVCPWNANLPANGGPNWVNPVKSQCRQIDALVVQAGANDAGFGVAARACSIPHFNCAANSIVAGDIASKVETLTNHLSTLASSITSGLNVGKVFMPEYPDILHTDNGTLCTGFTLPNAIADAATAGSGFFAEAVTRWGLALGGYSDGDMEPGEVSWLYNSLSVPINQKIAAAASGNGFVLVPVASDFRTHGYCSSQPWVVRYETSKWTQGNAEGTFHPNAEGQQAYAARIASSIASTVPGGAALAGQPYTSTVTYTPGDFNGDGKTDLIVTDVSGSYWYFSNGNGTWNVPYIRPDLPSGSVAYTPGDFNGDGKTDLIIVTPSGSHWYFSNGDGTWTYPYTRTDMPLGTVTYTPGDFNGDRKTDLVITNVTGSYWYFSNGNGTWTYPYTRNDLTSAITSYVPGDFDGDGKTDLIITTPSGSYWYYSNGNGTWNGALTRADLPRGVPTFTTGDFNGDGKTDLIVTTSTKSDWLFSMGLGSFSTLYTRADLTTTNTRYVPGDFSGDGKTDLVIVTSSGSHWYFSNGDGTWTYPYTRNDLPLNYTRYVTGNFNGDTKTDLVITNVTGSYWYFSNGDGTWTAPYTRTDLTL